MQNLANNVKFGGAKESYMDPLNIVLDRNRDRMNEFLLELTDVDDLSTVGGVCIQTTVIFTLLMLLLHHFRLINILHLVKLKLPPSISP